MGIEGSLILHTVSKAGDGIRTRDPQLGKLMLYQLSYTRWQAGQDSNPQPAVLETAALPIELPACA
jgi:hypothetical protein